MELIRDALRVLEQRLNVTPFLVGDNPTIVDVLLVSEVEQWPLLAGLEGASTPLIDLSSEAPPVLQWLQRMQRLPLYDDTRVDVKQLFESVP